MTGCHLHRGYATLGLGQVIRDVAGMSSAEFAVSMIPSGIMLFHIRRVVSAVGPRDRNDPYDPVRPRPYPTLPTGISLEYR